MTDERRHELHTKAEWWKNSPDTAIHGAYLAEAMMEIDRLNAIIVRLMSWTKGAHVYGILCSRHPDYEVLVKKYEAGQY